MNNLIHNNPPEAPLIDDIQWLAIQFVLGELSEEQSELFEIAMAEDVLLCEAVVAATQLTTGITLACGLGRTASASVAVMTTHELMEPVRPAFARTIVLGAALAIALTALAMISLQSSRPSSQSSVVVDDAVAAGALAMLLHDASNDTSSEFDEWNVPDDPVSSLVAPEWLLTAVDLDNVSNADERPVVSPDDES